MTQAITVAVLTCSDRCSRGETTDGTGPAVSELVTRALGAQVIARACLPDEAPAISSQLLRWARQVPPIRLILTNGGTGLAPRDVTPEATLAVLERRHPGLMELARSRCGRKTPRAYLSRGEAGVVGQTLIVNLPGSVRGATETLESLLDLLPHALGTLAGEVQDDGRPAALALTGRVIRHRD